MTERKVRVMVNHHADPSLRHYALVIGHNLGVVMDVLDLLRLTRVGWSPGALDLVVADTPCQPWSRADWPVSALPDGRLPNAMQLSTQAGAILQGFPADWHFAGNSKAARWRQIGNAMPPGVAAAVARAVRTWLSTTGED